jgi:hypothetical protein
MVGSVFFMSDDSRLGHLAAIDVVRWLAAAGSTLL